MLHGQDFYVLFIDLTKAFDTVSGTGLWASLGKIGCPDHFIRMVRSYHDDMKVTVGEGRKRAESFVVTNVLSKAVFLPHSFLNILLPDATYCFQKYIKGNTSNRRDS